jgi:hypothetical protein
MQWANRHNHKTPSTIWSGWSGTPNETISHWRLGDWLADVDLSREAEAVSILNAEGFLYTAQHFVGQLAASIFVGIEGEHLSVLYITPS